MTAKFWVGGSGTWDATTTTNWSLSSGGAGGAAVPGSADAVTIDANSGAGTITVNSNFNIGSLTTGAMGMTLDFSVNNNSVTIGGLGLGWSLTGTGTRTIKLGSGTFTFTDVSGNLWNAATSTNMTLNAGTSTILFSATATGARVFIPGAAQTYNNLTVNNAAANTGGITVFAGVTLNNFTLTNVRQVLLPNNQTVTINGALSYSGAGSQYGILTSTGGAAASLPATLSLANATTLQNLLVQNLIRAGVGTLTCSPCIDGGGNTTDANFTITPPSGGGGHIIGG